MSPRCVSRRGRPGGSASSWSGPCTTWTIRHGRSIRERLGSALGEHAPRTLVPDSPQTPLPHGGRVTVEPGGQVEISTAPATPSPGCSTPPMADLRQLTGLLDRAGLVLGGQGCDPHRPARPHPRHPAVRRDGARLRPLRPARPAHDVQHRRPAGLPRRRGSRTGSPPRWAAAARARARRWSPRSPTRRRHAGRDTGWASARMPPGSASTRRAPAAGRRRRATRRRLGAATRWTRRCCAYAGRRLGWDAPPGVTFADWIDGALPPAADLRRPRLPPEHAVPAGAAARLPRGALPGHPAGRRVDRPGGGAGRAARRRGDRRRGARRWPRRPPAAGCGRPGRAGRPGDRRGRRRAVLDLACRRAGPTPTCRPRPRDDGRRDDRRRGALRRPQPRRDSTR